MNHHERRHLMYLFIIILLGASLNAMAQDKGGSLQLYSTGPGSVGECVDADDLPIRLQAAGFGVVTDTGFITLHFIVSGNSLYKALPHSCCYVKAGDIHGDILNIYYSYRGGYLGLWTNEDEYRYDLLTEKIERFSSFGMLSPFLVRRIKSVSAMRKEYRCEKPKEESITHAINDTDDALPSLKHEHKPLDMVAQREGRGTGIDGGELSRILRIVNLEPDAAPPLAEFNIDKENLVEYVRWVTEEFEIEPSDLFYDTTYGNTPEERGATEAFYLGLVSSFDTVSSEVVRAALISSFDFWFALTGGTCSVTITNDAGDTLKCTFDEQGRGSPYNLPWTIRYGKEEFQTFNVDLSRMLTKMLPDYDEQENREADEKTMLLRAVADYLYERERGLRKVEGVDEE